MAIWEDYEYGECPLWYKCCVLLLVIGGCHLTYDGFCTPNPSLSRAMSVGDVIEHRTEGMLVILEVKHSWHDRFYFCRIMGTAEERWFRTGDFKEGDLHVSASIIERRVDSLRRRYSF